MEIIIEVNRVYYKEKEEWEEKVHTRIIYRNKMGMILEGFLKMIYRERRLQILI
jgi:hypothetical protein